MLAAIAAPRQRARYAARRRGSKNENPPRIEN
jgi:hypothetical protein